jgi:hypothetical protein
VVLDHLGGSKICETTYPTLVAATIAFLITLFLFASISRLYCIALEAARATITIKRPLDILSFFRMEGRFSFFTASELDQAAATTQLDVRARAAKELDQFLATPSVGAPAPNHPTTVRHVSRSDIEVAEDTFLRPVRDRGSAGISERVINKVLGTQLPDCVTVPNEPFNLSQSLPGGSPLVDLLRVRARNELG